MFSCTRPSRPAKAGKYSLIPNPVSGLTPAKPGGERVTHTAEGGCEGEVYLVMRESPTQLKEGVRVRYTW